MRSVDVYTFYFEGGRQIARKWLASDEDAFEYAKYLCDDQGASIEVARGEELDLIAIFDPDE